MAFAVFSSRITADIRKPAYHFVGDITGLPHSVAALVNSVERTMDRYRLSNFVYHHGAYQNTEVDHGAQGDFSIPHYVVEHFQEKQATHTLELVAQGLAAEIFANHSDHSERIQLVMYSFGGLLAPLVAHELKKINLRFQVDVLIVDQASQRALHEMYARSLPNTINYIANILNRVAISIGYNITAKVNAETFVERYRITSVDEAFSPNNLQNLFIELTKDAEFIPAILKRLYPEAQASNVLAAQIMTTTLLNIKLCWNPGQDIAPAFPADSRVCLVKATTTAEHYPDPTFGWRGNVSVIEEAGKPLHPSDHFNILSADADFVEPLADLMQQFFKAPAPSPRLMGAAPAEIQKGPWVLRAPGAAVGAVGAVPAPSKK